jgi:hypothetical protein
MDKVRLVSNVCSGKGLLRNVGVAERVINRSNKRQCVKAYILRTFPEKFMVSAMKRACMNFKTNIGIGYVSPARK